MTRLLLRSQLLTFLLIGLCFGFLLDSFIDSRIRQAQAEIYAAVLIQMPISSLSEFRI